MVELSFFQILEIIIGAAVIWVGIYLVARNPFSTLSWIVFLFLFGMGLTTFTDPILLNTSTFRQYFIWQKITDWPLFFSPVFYFHSSLLVSKRRRKDKFYLWLGYLLALIFTCLDIKGGLILNEQVIRFQDYKRFDGFAAGPLLIPSMTFACICVAYGIYKFGRQIKNGLLKYFLPMIAGLILLITGCISIPAFFVIIPWTGIAFTTGAALGSVIFVYSIIRFHLFSPVERNIFDRSFFYRTLMIFITSILYIVAIFISGIHLNFNVLILITILIILSLFTHSYYDWFGTFINDILYNFSSGFSVVSDQEVGGVIKNYNSPSRLESSSLLRLAILKNRKDKLTPVDSLRKIVKDAWEYFKPENDEYRRNKQNLKYYLIKMLMIDQAEEGQILWELGFDEYPVRIMTKENNLRPPLFQIKSPSDYTYTSRNAFLALKKEAIHDVAWRISYLEKLAKRKIF